MKATLVLLAIVGYLPLISSGAKSIHDWAHELGNKLGPGYSFREVQRDGRACICSTTTQQPTTQSLGETTPVATTSVAEEKTTTVTLPGTTEAAITTEQPEEDTTVPLPGTTEAAITTEEVVPTTEQPEEDTTVALPGTTEAAITTEKVETTPAKVESTSEEVETTPGIPTTTKVPTTPVVTTPIVIVTTPELQETTSPFPTTTFSSELIAGNIFGERAIKCDDNVVPVANDRNAATKYSFSTPLYPDEYPEHTCCVWRILYPEEWMRQGSSRIVTYNYSPDSFLPEECSTDFVTVYDITANNRLAEREEKCGRIGGQLGIIKHDGDERGAAFRVCRDEERTGGAKSRKSESTGKVAISFTVVAF